MDRGERGAAVTVDEFSGEWGYLLGNLNSRPQGDDEQIRYATCWRKLGHLTAVQLREAVDEYIEGERRSFPTWGDLLAIARRRIADRQEKPDSRPLGDPVALIVNGADPEFYKSQEWLTLCGTLDVKPELASVDWQAAKVERQRRLRCDHGKAGA